MSIVINIKPEAEAELTRQAAKRGVQPEDYAAALLEEAVHMGAAKKLTTDQLDPSLQDLAQFSGKIPLLPDEAFTREYQDHDSWPRAMPVFSTAILFCTSAREMIRRIAS